MWLLEWTDQMIPVRRRALRASRRRSGAISASGCRQPKWTTLCRRFWSPFTAARRQPRSRTCKAIYSPSRQTCSTDFIKSPPGYGRRLSSTRNSVQPMPSLQSGSRSGGVRSNVSSRQSANSLKEPEIYFWPTGLRKCPILRLHGSMEFPSAQSKSISWLL